MKHFRVLRIFDKMVQRIFYHMTSCNKKCYDHMCVNNFAGIRIRNGIDDVPAFDNNVKKNVECVHFEGDKILFSKSYD